jgi:hypothetical protein
MLTWTTKKPTAQGYYLYRVNKEDHELIRGYALPMAGGMEWVWPNEQVEYLANVPGEFAGPLEPTEE